MWKEPFDCKRNETQRWVQYNEFSWPVLADWCWSRPFEEKISERSMQFSAGSLRESKNEKPLKNMVGLGKI